MSELEEIRVTLDAIGVTHKEMRVKHVKIWVTFGNVSNDEMKVTHGNQGNTWKKYG